jgi:hypothetical protein
VDVYMPHDLLNVFPGESQLRDHLSE